MLIWGVWGSTSLASAHAGEKVVRFHGLSLRVPATWPVYNLSATPSTCVRFNRNAVYVGSPGAAQRCPAHQVGRTDALLIQGTASAARGGGPALPLSGSDHGTSAVLTIHGLRVTATWRRSPTTVAHALGLRRLSAGRADLSRSPVAPARAIAHVASVGTGLGFDPCATPSSSAMSAWKHSPYHFVGVYLGGSNMACSQPNLTNAWVRAETAAGWRFIPTYVGLQAPGTSCGCATIQPAHASAEGTAAGRDAVSRAKAVGIGTGNPIYFDMEAYTPGPGATGPARAFLTAWTSTLHSAGYVSGVYSSAASGISDLANAYGSSFKEPDDVWIANWNSKHTVADPYVPSSDWAVHQRLHQYTGGHDATYGGITMNIDSDYLDGAVAGFGSGPGSAPLFPEGAVLQDSTSQAFYRVAGGAPLFVSDLVTIGYVNPPTRVGAQQLALLNPVPANKTFLLTSAGKIFRVAGGMPFAVTSWSLFEGVKPYVLIDQWDIDNIANPASHLRSTPADGTIVEGLPSKKFWEFSSTGRYAVGASRFAVSVDDAGLAAFPLVQPPSGGGGLPGTTCLVPSLRHKTLAQVKRALGRAHCKLGKVSRPRHVGRHHTLRVVAQLPKPASSHPVDYRVYIRLT